MWHAVRWHDSKSCSGATLHDGRGQFYITCFADFMSKYPIRDKQRGEVHEFCLFHHNKCLCQGRGRDTDIWVMNKSIECIWHPFIWPCFPLLPLIILNYSMSTHVLVCSLASLLYSSGWMLLTETWISADNTYLREWVYPAAFKCITEKCNVKTQGLVCSLSHFSLCLWPHYDKLAPWFSVRLSGD